MSTREAIESALVENPDDLASHAAYADLLHEQGDPRGDFIQAQLALEDPSLHPAERKRHLKREKELLAKHQREWLGPLAPFLLDGRGNTGAEHRFARGWVAALTVPYPTAELLAALDSPTVKLLTDLHLETMLLDIGPLTRSKHLRAVRRLKLGKDAEEGSDEMMFPCDGTFHSRFVPDLVARQPHIEQLHLWASRYDMEKLFSLPMPALRYLKVYHQSDEHPLEALAANATLGQLTHLLFQPPRLTPHDDEVAFTPEGFDALCRSPHLTALTHLQMRMSPLGDAAIEALVSSGRIGRLTHLDLCNGLVSDAGARRLAEAGTLPNLQRLDLSGNRMTDAGRALLAGRGWLHAPHQWSGENAFFEVQFE